MSTEEFENAEEFENVVRVYAKFAGLVFDEDQELMWIIKEYLQNPPDGWELAIGEDENSGVPFFFHEETGQSEWEHPQHNQLLAKIEAERKVLKDNKRKKKEKEKKEVTIVEEMEVVDFDEIYPPKVTNEPIFNNLKGNVQDSKPAKLPKNTTVLSTNSTTSNSVNTASSWSSSSSGPPLASTQNLTSKVSKSQDYSRVDTGNKSTSYESERDRKERESRERDRQREIEQREKEREREREKEKIRIEREREREREKEREREREQRDHEKNRNKSRDDSASYELRELQEKHTQLRTRFQTDVESLRNQLTKLEDKLYDEKEERRDAEERAARTQTDYELKLRDVEEACEVRIRDTARKTRLDIEDDWKERMKSLERRHSEVVEELKSELASSKRRQEELQREADSAKRRVALSKEDGKLEMLSEVEELKQKLADSEQQARNQSNDLRKVREDHAILAGKLSSAQQMAQILRNEAEAAKAEAASAVSEGHVNHVALTQAIQRIQALDSENGSIRAEVILLRKDNENQSIELRKLQGNNSNSGERMTQAEADVRRVKAQSQVEISRLASKVAELETINNILSEKADKASDNTALVVKEVQRLLDKSEYEVIRLKERIHEMEKKSDNDTNRVINLEREITKLQDELFKKDANIREEKQRVDLHVARVDEVRFKYEQEIDNLRKDVQKEKDVVKDNALKHTKEIENMKRDIQEKIPKIASQAVSKIESQWVTKLEQETSSVRSRYEQQIESMRREMIELATTYTEKEARQRSLFADDKAELERLRYQNQRLQRRCDDLEQDVEDFKRALAGRYSNNLSSNSMIVERKEDNDTMLLLQNQLAFMKQQLAFSLGHEESKYDNSFYNTSNTSRYTKPVDRSYREPQIPIDIDETRATQTTDNTENKQTESLFETPRTANKITKTPMKSEFLPRNNRSDVGGNYSFLSTNSTILSANKKTLAALNDVDDTYASISDGSYHEGYWRMKYLKGGPK